MEEKKCKFCATMIPKEAKVCPNCRKQIMTSTPTKIFLGLIIFIALASWMGSSSTPSRTTASVPIGNDGTLNSGAEIVPVAISEAAYESFSKARYAKDEMGIQQLLITGNVFTVQANTKVKVIDQAMFIRKVRILNGISQGLSGWVPTEYIK